MATQDKVFVIFNTDGEVILDFLDREGVCNKMLSFESPNDWNIEVFSPTQQGALYFWERACEFNKSDEAELIVERIFPDHFKRDFTGGIKS